MKTLSVEIPDDPNFSDADQVAIEIASEKRAIALSLANPDTSVFVTSHGGWKWAECRNGKIRWESSGPFEDYPSFATL